MSAYAQVIGNANDACNLKDPLLRTTVQRGQPNSDECLGLTDAAHHSHQIFQWPLAIVVFMILSLHA